MNLPNKLTVLRVILVPFFVFFLLGADWIGSFSPYIALIIFIVASLTDMLDGKIARKYNLITNFGKFMDPLADKLLVCSALICFVDMHRMPTWVVLIVIAREFIISGFRLVAAEGGTVIAAGIWGKYNGRHDDHDHFHDPEFWRSSRSYDRADHDLSVAGTDRDLID